MDASGTSDPYIEVYVNDVQRAGPGLVSSYISEAAGHFSLTF